MILGFISFSLLLTIEFADLNDKLLLNFEFAHGQSGKALAGTASALLRRLVMHALSLWCFAVLPLTSFLALPHLSPSVALSL